MARINYKIDRELADLGMLRVSIVAKALNVAPKTVNLWANNYTISKVGGVKYLTWTEVFKNNSDTANTFGLSLSAIDVYSKVTGATQPSHVVTKTNDSLAKAKALLQKKQVAVQTITEETVELLDAPVLSSVEPEPGVLTIPPEYKHLVRK